MGRFNILDACFDSLHPSSEMKESLNEANRQSSIIGQILPVEDALKVLAHRPLDPTAPSDGVLIQATHPLLCDGCMLCVESCEPGAISIESPPET